MKASEILTKRRAAKAEPKPKPSWASAAFLAVEALMDKRIGKINRSPSYADVERKLKEQRQRNKAELEARKDRVDKLFGTGWKIVEGGGRRYEKFDPYERELARERYARVKSGLPVEEWPPRRPVGRH